MATSVMAPLLGMMCSTANAGSIAGSARRPRDTAVAENPSAMKTPAQAPAQEPRLGAGGRLDASIIPLQARPRMTVAAALNLRLLNSRRLSEIADDSMRHKAEAVPTALSSDTIPLQEWATAAAGEDVWSPCARVGRWRLSVAEAHEGCANNTAADAPGVQATPRLPRGDKAALPARHCLQVQQRQHHQHHQQHHQYSAHVQLDGPSRRKSLPGMRPSSMHTPRPTASGNQGIGSCAEGPVRRRSDAGPRRRAPSDVEGASNMPSHWRQQVYHWSDFQQQQQQQHSGSGYQQRQHQGCEKQPSQHKDRLMRQRSSASATTSSSEYGRCTEPLYDNVAATHAPSPDPRPMPAALGSSPQFRQFRAGQQQQWQQQWQQHPGGQQQQAQQRRMSIASMNGQSLSQEPIACPKTSPPRVPASVSPLALYARFPQGTLPC